MIGLTTLRFVEWRMGVGVLVGFADHAPDQLDALVGPQERVFALHLSSESSPSMFEEGLLFLRVPRQANAASIPRIFGMLDVDSAIRGWGKALTGKGAAKAAAAFLVHHAMDTPDRSVRWPEPCGNGIQVRQRHPRPAFVGSERLISAASARHDLRRFLASRTANSGVAVAWNYDPDLGDRTESCLLELPL